MPALLKKNMSVTTLSVFNELQLSEDAESKDIEEFYGLLASEVKKLAKLRKSNPRLKILSSIGLMYFEFTILAVTW